jgi:hypothetical protein
MSSTTGTKASTLTTASRTAEQDLPRSTTSIFNKTNFKTSAGRLYAAMMRWMKNELHFSDNTYSTEPATALIESKDVTISQWLAQDEPTGLQQNVPYVDPGDHAGEL